MKNNSVEQKLVKFLLENGHAVMEDNSPRIWTPTEEATPVSPYGWAYDRADEHSKTCPWTADPDYQVLEVDYSMFFSTFDDNYDEYGLNLQTASCSCGKYKNVTLRYIGTVGQALQTILTY